MRCMQFERRKLPSPIALCVRADKRIGWVTAKQLALKAHSQALGPHVNPLAPHLRILLNGLMRLL
jgi:hypothetical protein